VSGGPLPASDIGGHNALALIDYLRPPPASEVGRLNFAAHRGSMRSMRSMILSWHLDDVHLNILRSKCPRDRFQAFGLSARWLRRATVV
jgi:hypothetical protein